MTNRYSNFSKLSPIILDKKSRLEKAKQIVSILKVHLDGQNLQDLKVLDVGCSSGIITAYLADHVGQISGIDVDKKAIALAKKNFKKKNLNFEEMDATITRYRNNYFDILICNQIYCHFENPQYLMTEVYRVLKPGGICVLGASNRWYLKIIGKKDPITLYYKSFWQLRKLCSRFIIHGYTARILHDPKKFKFTKLAPYQRLFHIVPITFWEKIEPIISNFIWILEKPID